MTPPFTVEALPITPGMVAIAATIISLYNDANIGGEITEIIPTPYITRYVFKPNENRQIARMMQIPHDGLGKHIGVMYHNKSKTERYMLIDVPNARPMAKSFFLHLY